MIKVYMYLITLFSILHVSCYADELSKDIYDYIELLTRKNEPTLAEYSKYSGECGGESELLFIQDECKKRYGDIFSNECIKFSRDMCENSKNTASLELGWIRKQFATAGKRYDIIRVEHHIDIHEEEEENVTRNYQTIFVKIGDNLFELYYAENYNVPPGLFLYIQNINHSSLRFPYFDMMNEYVRVKEYDFTYKTNEVCKSKRAANENK